MFAMAKPFNIANRLFFSVNLEKARDWRNDASNLDEWEAWDLAQRKRLGFFAGLGFWEKTNVAGSRVLLSRHWPHRLCWDWSVWVSRYRGAEFDGPRKCVLSISRKYRRVSFQFVFFRIELNWQNSQWMGACGPIGATAPKILWAHHLANAEPAGHA